MKQKHDAENGFYDIKALPEAETGSLLPELLLAIAGLIILALLFFAARKLDFFKTGSPASQAADIYRLARERISTAMSDFGGGKIDKKELGEGISSSLRTLLTQATDYPAEDRTFGEIDRNLAPSLRDTFSCLEPQKIKNFSARTREVLKLTSDICYRSPGTTGELTASQTEYMEKVAFELIGELKQLSDEQSILETQEKKQNEL